MAMYSSATSSPGAMYGTAAQAHGPALHAPALSDLSGFLANVSHQIATLQYEMEQIKQQTGISFPAYNPDMHFAHSLAHHINESRTGEAKQPPGQVPSHSDAADSAQGINSNTGLHCHPVPAASAALRASFAPQLATGMRSPDSSIPSDPNTRAVSPMSHSVPERPFSAGAVEPATRPMSGASVRSARPGSIRNIIVAAGDQTQILNLTQMVEKFEERVEDRLEEMEAKLAATEGILQASEQADSEKITKVGKQVESLERDMALLKSGTENSAASAQEATMCTAALTSELAEMRKGMHDAIKVLQQQVDPHTQKEAEKRAAAATASVDEIMQTHAKLQVRIREIEGGAERMRGEHRTLSGQMASLERQRGELAATVRKVEKVAKVELDEATGAIQAQLTAAADLKKRSDEALKSLEHRAETWDRICDRVDAYAVSAAEARDSLKSVFAQEAAALASHLSNSDETIKALTIRFNEALEEVDRLSTNKQDAVSAVTMEMVNRRVAAGIDEATERNRHADRQLGAMQLSIEELIRTKADKGDIATASKLKSGLIEIQQKSADAVRDGMEEVKVLVASKAEGQLLRNIETEVARRFTSLEGALLKGLQDYDTFRGVMNSRLSEIHRALGELLPTARAQGASPNRTSCLSCDQRVRSNGDVMHALHGAGAPMQDFGLREQLARVASPQALPRTAPVGGRKPISAVDPIGASHNAWLASKSRKFASLYSNQQIAKRQQTTSPGQLRSGTVQNTRPHATPVKGETISATSDVHGGWSTTHENVLE